MTGLLGYLFPHFFDNDDCDHEWSKYADVGFKSMWQCEKCDERTKKHGHTKPPQ